MNLAGINVSVLAIVLASGCAAPDGSSSASTNTVIFEVEARNDKRHFFIRLVDSERVAEARRITAQ